MANKDVVICAPVRTAIGTYGGTLKDTASSRYLAPCVVRATLERAKLTAWRREHHRFGQCDPSRQQDEPCSAGGHSMAECRLMFQP